LFSRRQTSSKASQSSDSRRMLVRLLPATTLRLMRRLADREHSTREDQPKDQSTVKELQRWMVFYARGDASVGVPGTVERARPALSNRARRVPHRLLRRIAFGAGLPSQARLREGERAPSVAYRSGTGASEHAIVAGD
jgi:hypothetical protein